MMGSERKGGSLLQKIEDEARPRRFEMVVHEELVSVDEFGLEPVAVACTQFGEKGLGNYAWEFTPNQVDNAGFFLGKRGLKRIEVSLVGRGDISLMKDFLESMSEYRLGCSPELGDLDRTKDMRNYIYVATNLLEKRQRK